MVRQLVGVHVALQPALVGRRLGAGMRGHGAVQRQAARRDEAGCNALQFGLGDQVRAAAVIVFEDVAELGRDRIDEGLALGLDQDLDARLVEVVAPAHAVVDTHDGLDEHQDLLPGHELADDAADHRRASHAAAHQHLEADLAGAVLQQLQPDVVPADGGAVFTCAADRNLELARQERELGMQRAPLAQDLAIGPRVHHLVGGDTGQCVAGDVADAVAAGLDAVHVDFGQQVHHVGGARQRNPVELQVLARGEVAVVAVELAGDARQLVQLPAAQLAIGHGHAQHGRVALNVPAVLQAQRLEVVLRQRTVQVAAQLVAELGGAGLHEVAVEVGVAVHGVDTAGARPLGWERTLASLHIFANNRKVECIFEMRLRRRTRLAAQFGALATLGPLRVRIGGADAVTQAAIHKRNGPDMPGRRYPGGGAPRYRGDNHPQVPRPLRTATRV